MCSQRELFLGSWNVTSLKYTNGVSIDCPKTFIEIDAGYQGSYVCTGKNGNMEAMFLPEHSCKVLSIDNAVKSLEASPYNHSIIFLGDSLMNQRYYSLKCILENRKSRKIRPFFIFSSTLNRR
jgi:hypothetical protein